MRENAILLFSDRNLRSSERRKGSEGTPYPENGKGGTPWGGEKEGKKYMRGKARYLLSQKRDRLEPIQSFTKSGQKDCLRIPARGTRKPVPTDVGSCGKIPQEGKDGRPTHRESLVRPVCLRGVRSSGGGLYADTLAEGR